MSRITIQDAKGWVRGTKFTIDDLDTDLLDQIEAEVLGRVATSYATGAWISPSTTPRLIRTTIAKLYVCYMYQKAYSEDEDSLPAYARSLFNNAEMLITGINDGTITLDDATPSSSTAGQPSFYPSDASSALCPGDMGDTSLGDSKFSMGKVF